MVRADRPFLFAIRDVPTGTILFLGRTVNPPRNDGGPADAQPQSRCWAVPAGNGFCGHFPPQDNEEHAERGRHDETCTPEAKTAAMGQVIVLKCPVDHGCVLSVTMGT